MWRAVKSSAALRAAVVLGLGGVAFSLGNLLLARVLSSAQYGEISLWLGIVSVAGLAAPLGMDLVIGRRGIPLDRAWRHATVTACGCTAAVAALIGALCYRLDSATLGLLILMTVAAGLLQAESAHYQGQRRFGAAAWLLQGTNGAILVGALMTLAASEPAARLACAWISATALLAAAASWIGVIRNDDRSSARAAEASALSPAQLLPEALALMTITASSSVFLQLERLVVGPLLGMADLALFGVLAALVGSPFRMLQAAVQFTLVPGLRAAPDARSQWRLLRREALVVAGICIAGAFCIALVAPWVAHELLGGRYELTSGPLVAALTTGILKVTCGIALALVVALAQESGLRRLSVYSWASIPVSVLGAVLGARWGLAGLLYGIGAGWVVRTLMAGWLAAGLLRRGSGSTRLARALV